MTNIEASDRCLALLRPDAERIVHGPSRVFGLTCRQIVSAAPLWHAAKVPDWDFARVFAVVRRVLAGFFALSWYTFSGFGLSDLTVTWNAEWPQVLEAGWACT